MFEAKLLEGNILKKIVEAIKDVVSDVNIDVSPSGKLAVRLVRYCVGVFDVMTISYAGEIAAQFSARYIPN